MVKRNQLGQFLPKLNKFQIKEICKEHSKGKTQKELGIENNVHPTTIYYLFKRIGIKSHSKAYRKNRKYYLNENCFVPPLDEHNAYWIGFIMADGCIYQRKHYSHSPRLIISCHQKDKGHLEKFKKDIQTNHPIYHYRKPRLSATINIISKKICSNLAYFNIIPRKTFLAETPTNIPDNLMRHFWRGMFDGDGCLSLINQKHKDEVYSYWESQFCGTKDIVENFIKFTGEKITLRKQGNIFECSAYSSKAFRIATLLYKDATVYLDRKYQLYQKMKGRLYKIKRGGDK